MAAEDRQVVPRRWRAAIRVLAPASDRDGILADLDEEARAIAATQGQPAARRFVRWQIAHSTLPWLSRRGREAARHFRSGMTMMMFRGIGADIRRAARRLAQGRGFTVLAVATLAIGIGAVSTVFSLAHAVWLKPLPYHEPDRLVWIHARHEASGNAGSLTPIEFAEYQRESRTLSGLAGFTYGAGIARVNGEPVRIVSHYVSANLFGVLGVRPAIGRDFVAADVGGTPVVMLGDAIWRSRFAADRDVAGQALTLDGVDHVVVGVMPRGFTFPRGFEADVWIPGDFSRHDAASRTVQTVARLASDATLETANVELKTRAAQVALSVPGASASWTTFAVTAGETTSATGKLAFQALLATVGLFLLVACSNLAGLMLARHATRRTEFAVCLSIGASRWRLARALVIETLLLSMAGAAAGVLVATAASRALAAVMPPRLPGLDDVNVNATVIGVTIAAAVVSALLIALLPALRFRHLRPADAVAGGRSIAVGGARAQRGLVAAEIALAVMLLVGAAAMLQSFRGLLNRDRGYAPQGLYALNVSLPFADDSYLPIDRRARAFDDILARAASVPGVRQVAATTGFPGSQLGILGASELALPGRRPLIAAIHASSPDYFAALGTPMLAGRAFTRSDTSAATPVVIVNEQLAREFPDGNPIGRHIPLLVYGETRQYEIVGVAGNISLGPRAGYRVFVPLAQASPYWIDLVFRADTGPGAVAAVRAALRQHSADLLLENESSFQQIISDSVGLERAQATVVALIGGLAAIVAGIGIYALMTFVSAQRRRELGLRLALGSSPRQLFRDTLFGAFRLVAIGLAAGVIVATVLVRTLASQVFGLTSADVLTHAIAAGVVLVVAAIAVWVPARRVMHTDPLVAMRME